MPFTTMTVRAKWRRPSMASAAIALLLTAAILAFFGSSASAQNQTAAMKPLFPQRTIFWFNNYDPDRTVWNEAQVYHSPDTTVKTATSTSHDFQVWRDKQIIGLPVQPIDGVRSLVIDTINPGNWNLHFIMGSGNVVNLDRVGPAPILHLRLKWGTILPNNLGDVKISVDKASLLLSQYAVPSTAKWQDVNIPLADFKRVAPDLDLSHTGGISLSSVHKYSAESILYLSEMSVVPALGPAALREDLVKVDLSGWRTHDPKFALFTYPYDASEGGAPANARFAVRNVATHKVIYTGRLISRSGPPQWNQTGDAVYAASFDKVTAPGRYQIEVPDVRIGTDQFTAKSVVFPIDDDVYTKEFRDALRYFYYERGGYPIVEPYGEGFTRPAAYPMTAAIHYHYASADGNYHYTNPVRDVLGGWCDAGDPSLQVPDHGAAIWWLSNALRDFGPQVPARSLNLPEVTPGVSDIAPLMNFGLQWMTKMCNPDGSVMNTVGWENGKTEELTDADSVAASWATAGFAKAYLVLKDLPAYRHDADTYLALAKKSWAWLQAHPQPVTQVTSPTPVDPNYDRQGRVFAAVELYNATGDDQYHQFFLKPFKASGSDVLTAWGGAGQGDPNDKVLGYLNFALQFAYLDYIESPQPTADKATQQILKDAFLRQVRVAAYDRTGERKPYLTQTPYQFAMLDPSHLYWGSNDNVMSVLGVVLLRTYKWTGDIHYRNAALDELHFINGRNPVGRDFVTGEAPDYEHGADFYSQLWTDLHHQAPGVVGAFIKADNQLNAYIPQPWKRFISFQEASTEEPDIGWNCEFAYFTAAFAQPLMPGGHLVSQRKRP
ncbi:MAG: glycoside hydrolase family 9 protein [Janthinobacterium lividum]